MTETIQLPPWPHKMPYGVFLEKVIERTRKQCERNFGYGLLPHHKRLITLCRDKDLPTLNVLYNKAKKERFFVSSFEAGMDKEEKFFIIEWITNCVLAAYNLQPAPKRLKPQHIAEVKAILENSFNDKA